MVGIDTLIARSAICVCASLLSISPVRADDSASAPAPSWPGNFVARLEALAFLETLNAELLSHDSATLTLEHWCGVHQLASPPNIVTARIPVGDKPPTPGQRRDLAVTPAEPIRYRRVRLLCGPLVLSEADNWYVPGRLTAEMNRLLDTTDMPFGKVVQALHFQRHILSAKLLWLPLPEAWEINRTAVNDGAMDLPIPPFLLEHRAVLTLPDGTPFSEVLETYTRNVLGSPPPRP